MDSLYATFYSEPVIPDRNPELFSLFMHPLHYILEHYTRHRRDCGSVTDLEYLSLGCMRVLQQARSGRDFLQQQRDIFDRSIPVPTFFRTLHSRRRLRLLEECSERVAYHGMRAFHEKGIDLLEAIPELQSRPVWAIDGHKIKHACHAMKDLKGVHVPPNSIYVLCLHHGILQPLAPVQGNGVYAHEMRVFKNKVPAFLATRSVKSKQRPLCIVDKAYIDNEFWDNMRTLRKAGAHLVTRPKENISPKQVKALGFDSQNPINAGIEQDSEILLEGNITMRFIIYRDPETKNEYHFLTTDMDLRPGVIAWLYLLRWRIEKVFDTSKNKLEEVKAWAGGAIAQEIQSHFLTITHNLLALFREHLQHDYAIKEEKLEKKRKQRNKERKKQAKADGAKVHPLNEKMPPVVQMSLQYVRVLRNSFLCKKRLDVALPNIAASMYKYL
jgi:hypothetical protein